MACVFFAGLKSSACLQCMQSTCLFWVIDMLSILDILRCDRDFFHDLLKSAQQAGYSHLLTDAVRQTRPLP